MLFFHLVTPNLPYRLHQWVDVANIGEGSHSTAVCLCYYKTFSKPTSEAGHWPLVHGEESCVCLGEVLQVPGYTAMAGLTKTTFLF